MAKIIYDQSPVDSSKRIIKEFDSDKTLEQILDELECLGNCSVEVNGVIPDEVRLDTKFNEKDIVRIRKPLHGSSEESGKLIQTIGTIVGIVVSLIPGFQAVGAAIIAASNLVGGLIIANGVKPPKLQERSEGEQAAQVFNLTASQNEVRKLEPMNLVLGCHRLAPDFGSQPYSKYTGGGTASNITIRTTDYLEVNQNFPTILPAGWLANNVMNQFTYNPTSIYGIVDPSSINWWPYQLGVMTNWNAATYITNSVVDQVIAGFPSGNDDFYDYVNFSNRYDFSYNTPSGNVAGRGPILIQHFDPSDPVVQAHGGPFVSTLEMLQWAFFSQYKMDMRGPGAKNFGTLSEAAGTTNPVSTYYGSIEDIYLYLLDLHPFYTNSNPATVDAQIAASLGESAAAIRPMRNLYSKKDHTQGLQADGGDAWFFVQMTQGMVFDVSEPENYDPTPEQVFGDFDPLSFAQRKALVDNFIAGLNVPGNNPTIIAEINQTASVLSEPRTQQVTHLFHYGFGDLNITDRRIGDTEFDKIFGSQNVRNTENQTDWPIDQNLYHSNVKVVDGAELLNENDGNFSGPEFLESLDPSVLSNWVTRETPDNTYRICINIEGRSFESLDNGDFQLFGANFEIQARDVVNDVLFSVIDGSKFLGSNKADPIRETLEYTFPPGKYEIRIRKRTKDPVDANKIQEFAITSFNFFVTDGNEYLAENREGVKLEATGSFNGTTQKYNTFVEMSAWVFDGANWNWEKTRNPAWLFLYYARGGFTNNNADGSLSYPYSPTVGWINNAEHPDNIERLFGAGLEDDCIDLDKIIEWAQFCDDNDLRGDLIVRSDSSAHDVLQRIANTGRASVTYYCSKLSVVYEDPNEPVTGMFGMSNILKGSFSINYAVEDVPYKVVGKYTDRDDEWKTNEVEAIVPNSIPDNLNIEEIVLDGITERDRAQREVNIIAARQAYQRRTYNWSTAIEGLTVQRGDKVYLSHDVTCYDQSGRVYGAKVEDGLVTELETGICLGTTTDIMLRFLDGSISTHKATNDGSKLILEVGIPVDQFPGTLDQDGTDNPASVYPGSVIEDIVFFAGPKATPGKAVRITGVEPQDGINRFRISAVEEDPVIWAFEYDNTATPEEESFERVQASIKSAGYEQIGENKYKIYWELDGAHAAIVQQSVGAAQTTLQSEGQYTQFKECAVFDFDPDGVYNLEIVPVTFGQVYETTGYKLTIRT